VREQWEYRMVTMPRFVDADAILNNLGKKGWELCGIEYGQFILKRRVEQIKEEDA
jgi:hypothetical protein